MPWGSERWLIQTHRRAQIAIGARAARAVRDAWLRTIQPRWLEATVQPWLEESLRQVAQYREQSAQLAAAQMRLLRGMRLDETLPELRPGPFARPQVTRGELRQDFAALAEVYVAPRRDDNVPVAIDEDYAWPEQDTAALDDAARTSLIVTGPIHAEQQLSTLERGRLDDPDFLAELDRIDRDSAALAAGNAEREVLRGGRDLQAEAARADDKVIGWARITGPDPCAFCAMLASRGAVYRSKDIAKYKGQNRRWGPPVDIVDLEKYHPNCHCEPRAIYSRTDWIPPESQGFQDLWYLATEDYSGRDALNAYRRAIEARRRARARRGHKPMPEADA